MATSKSREGGVSFHDLCNGKQGYSFNLTSLKGTTTIEEATGTVANQITDTIRSLSSQSHLQPIEKIYIGKTSTWKIQKYPEIDPMNQNTMNKQRINGRWNNHKSAGKDGMVIVAVLNEEVAKSMKSEDVHMYDRSRVENCTLTIERNLQKRFRDKRSKHGEDYFAGPSGEGTEACLLYIAFNRREQVYILTCNCISH